tara:strand:- start:407 stop:1069 length:663 start_codon:yes stop_codon:yes gene_type:complete
LDNIDILKKKYGIGLTGGIACGKTTVSHILRDMGFTVIDADQLARQAVAAETDGLTQIVKSFGKIILTDQGELNRSMMADIVFKDHEKKVRLESIIHPAIHKILQKKLNEEGLVKTPRIWFYEAALIFEIGGHTKFRNIWAVHCPEEVQVKRLKQRDQRSDEQIENILSNQIPAKEKADKADISIDTNVGINVLENIVKSAVEKLPSEYLPKDLKLNHKI